jgi:uncharacterized membrane protein
MIRKVKVKLNIAKNNRLYVCKEHLEDYIKKRKAYIRDTYIAWAIVILLFIFAVGMPILSGKIYIGPIISMMILSVLILLLVVVMKYVPPLVDEKKVYENVR